MGVKKGVFRGQGVDRLLRCLVVVGVVVSGVAERKQIVYMI